jgi:hypothetical protein
VSRTPEYILERRKKAPLNPRITWRGLWWLLYVGVGVAVVVLILIWSVYLPKVTIPKVYPMLLITDAAIFGTMAGLFWGDRSNWRVALTFFLLFLLRSFGFYFLFREIQYLGLLFFGGVSGAEFTLYSQILLNRRLQSNHYR